MTIIPVLRNSHLGKNQGSSWFKTLFQGEYTDYVPEWFGVVGLQIWIPTIILALSALHALIIEWAIQALWRCYYRKIERNKR